MPLTTSTSDIFYLTTPEEVELDSDRPATDAEIVAEFEVVFTPLTDAADLDVTGDDAFGV